MKQWKQFVDSYPTYKTVWLWPSFKGCKGHRKVNSGLIWDTDVENISVLSKGSKSSLKSYRANNRSWAWPSLKGHKSHRQANIELIWDIDVESIHSFIKHKVRWINNLFRSPCILTEGVYWQHSVNTILTYFLSSWLISRKINIVWCHVHKKCQPIVWQEKC